MTAGPQRYDLALFLHLNAEYERKKVHANPPPVYEADKRREYKRRIARNVARDLADFVGLRRKAVMDFGCGRGDLALALAEEFECSVVGVDVRQYPEWADLAHPTLRLLATDLCEPPNARRLAGQFDVVVSNSVLEHVAHPFRALEGVKTVLRSGGVAWLKINLYRGPLASHRYRDVFFPWPHLLFTDEVFVQFYAHVGQTPRGPAWVNKLTHLHYKDYFERIGFEVLREGFSTRPFDEAFYARFEDVLGKYPRSDLERDFLNVIVRPR